MSCREYFTVRAAPASATAGSAQTPRQSTDKIGRLLRTDFNLVRISISLLLMCSDFGIIETGMKLTGDFQWEQNGSENSHDRANANGEENKKEIKHKIKAEKKPENQKASYRTGNDNAPKEKNHTEYTVPCHP